MTVPFGPWLVGFRGQVIPLFIVGDIISDNWNGAIPPSLPDFAATLGYALQASNGSAQFSGPVYFPWGDVVIGNPASTDSQLFIDNTLQHLNLRAVDDPLYPDYAGIIDMVYDAVEGRLLRIFAGDFSGVPDFKRLLEIFPDDFVANFFPGETPGGDAALSISLDGLLRENQPAYMTLGTLVYTANDSFVKADYPALRGIRVRCQAAGGGAGGGAATAAGSVSGGGNGGGGEYVENLFIPVSDLAASEAITVGNGGTAGAAGNNPGGGGGDSVFDTISGEVRANGGVGGGGGASTPPLTGVMGNAAAGGSGGTGGHFTVSGGDAIQSFTLAAGRLYPGAGGSSFMSGAQSRATAGGTFAASPGKNWGGGGQGGGNDGSGNPALAGDVGGDGLVLVDLFT